MAVDPEKLRKCIEAGKQALPGVMSQVLAGAGLGPGDEDTMVAFLLEFGVVAARKEGYPVEKAVEAFLFALGRVYDVQTGVIPMGPSVSGEDGSGRPN